jgi:hypothetical protein
VQASRNYLTCLPKDIGNMPNLELLRVAVNRLECIPDSLAHSPSLAWFSLAGNPACHDAPAPKHTIADISIKDVELGRHLGDGASGDVFEVTWQGRTCAMKRFKDADEVSPDGCHTDEVAIQLLVDHPKLTLVEARIREPDALVMRLEIGQPMALKPNSDSLLRCRWSEDVNFPLRCAWNVVILGRMLWYPLSGLLATETAHYPAACAFVKTHVCHGAAVPRTLVFLTCE